MRRLKSPSTYIVGVEVVEISRQEEAILEGVVAISPISSLHGGAIADYLSSGVAALQSGSLTIGRGTSLSQGLSLMHGKKRCSEPTWLVLGNSRVSKRIRRGPATSPSRSKSAGRLSG